MGKFRATSTLLSILAVFLCMAPTSASELEWESKTIETTADLGQEELTVTYKFQNTSKKTITISSTQTSCGCTIANLEKKTYAPGEQGELPVVFETRGSVGRQTKHLTIFIGEGESNSDELVLTVDIPQAVELSPRIHIWRLGTEFDERIIEVTLHESLDFEIDSLEAVNEDAQYFDYTIEKASKPNTLIIKLKPVSTPTPARGRFILASKNGNPDILKKYQIYAFVR